MSRPRLITFDCYGTLIDWNAGIAAAFAAEAERQGISVEPDAILPAYHAAEPRVQSERYRTYREVLNLLEPEIAAELGWRRPETEGFLAASLPGWPPFDDTVGALRQLTAMGFDLGILSNIDDDLLAATRRLLGVEFAVLVTAQQVRSYKPATRHFERALELVGGDRGAMLHVAQSYFHDVQPAVALGIDVVWVNRLGETVPPGAPLPTHEVADLDGAVGWIERRYGEDAMP